LRRAFQDVSKEDFVNAMSLRDIQFAESPAVSPARPAAPSSSAAPRPHWAARRAPSWRRAGPRVVVAPVRKTVRAVAFDVIAIAIGLGLGVSVVAAVTFSGVLG
jgi:hypothetical protein